MAEKTRVFLFGHSFPVRLLKWSKDRSKTVEESVGVSGKYSIYVDGHPGLTFDRFFTNERHYFRKLQSQSFDILCIDMATNDLCAVGGTPQIVVDKVSRVFAQQGRPTRLCNFSHGCPEIENQSTRPGLCGYF